MIHLFVDVIVYGKYANDGINYYGGVTFGAYLCLWHDESVAVLLCLVSHAVSCLCMVCVGNVLEAIGLLIFIMMLLLLSKGFTITRGRISQKGTIMLVVFFFIYVVVYIILFILQAVVSHLAACL